MENKYNKEDIDNIIFLLKKMKSNYEESSKFQIHPGGAKYLLGQTLRQNVTTARQLISDGQPFAQAMTSCGLTTPVASQLFRVGEKSGRLDVMMERAASFHEEEMLRWVDAFTKVFEPLLMAAIGLVIGLIVLLMYLPIFELASGIQ